MEMEIKYCSQFYVPSEYKFMYWQKLENKSCFFVQSYYSMKKNIQYMKTNSQTI